MKTVYNNIFYFDDEKDDFVLKAKERELDNCRLG